MVSWPATGQDPPMLLSPLLLSAKHFWLSVSHCRCCFRGIFWRRRATSSEANYPDRIFSSKLTFWDHPLPPQCLRSPLVTSPHLAVISSLFDHFLANQRRDFVGCHHEHLPHSPICRSRPVAASAPRLSVFSCNGHSLPAFTPTYPHSHPPAWVLLTYLFAETSVRIY